MSASFIAQDVNSLSANKALQNRSSESEFAEEMLQKLMSFALNGAMKKTAKEQFSQNLESNIKSVRSALNHVTQEPKQKVESELQKDIASTLANLKPVSKSFKSKIHSSTSMNSEGSDNLTHVQKLQKQTSDKPLLGLY